MRTDLLIIGGGPGGYEIAAEAARHGRTVTLIEKDQLGGTCLNRGCIPTKCLCASAGTILTVKNAEQFGVSVDGFSLHYDQAAARMRQVVEQLRQGIDMLLKGVNVIKGTASIVPLSQADEADRSDDGAQVAVKVGDNVITAEQILIATGSKPAMLPIPGAELAMTSDDFLKLDTLPARVAIIGGGVIGMEFASILAAFGIETTVVEYCKEILPPFDKEVAKRLRTSLSRRGFKTIVGAAVSAIAKDGDSLTVTYAGKRGNEQLACDAVIMAVGRRPVTPEGCEENGIAMNRGFIVVNDSMLTSIPGVYAVGDCNGRCMLAHAAAAQARVALGAEVDLDLIPSAVFTIPECAMVGPTEEQCQTENINYGVAKAMFAANGKALSMGEGEGFAKVIYSRATRMVLACHVIGPHAADIVAEATACISAGNTLEDIASTIVHGHPTLSEILAAACAAAQA